MSQSIVETQGRVDPSQIKILQHLPALCNQIRRVAIEAGSITLNHFDESGYKGADVKADDSPVTLADQEAEKYITAQLAQITPGILVIGEEAVAKGYRPDLTNEEYFWLVDPLDGTKEFISGSGDYTVNIALIHHKKPVLGVVYAPVHGHLYAGCGEGTAIKYDDDNETEKEISVRDAPHKGLTVVSSKSHGKGQALDDFLSHYMIAKQVQRGSSLKMCVIAEGKADLYPRFGLTCEWDTAAAHAVLNSAGGVITDIDGNELTYGGADPKFLNPEFIARSRYIDLPDLQ